MHFARNILNKSSKLFSLKTNQNHISRRLKSVFEKEDFAVEYLENDKKGIVVATMKRLREKNALSKSFVTQFEEGLNQIRRDPQVNVMVLRSAVPGVFCAGADLKERLEMPEKEVEPTVMTLRKVSVDISSLPFPTIAALDGLAVGGGFEFALSCDLRVAAQNAKVGLVETKLAIIPGAGGTQRLPRLVGPSVAKDLILTARIVNADEALHLGLINRLVEQDSTKEAAYNAALIIAQQMNSNGPLALRLAKQAIDKGMETTLNEGLFFEKAFYAKVIPTKDRIEGLRSFVEKRSPSYKGE